eukprot:scaffold1610_cov257-Pinguiococcus_pyrenoidosus.AAC.15
MPEDLRVSIELLRLSALLQRQAAAQQLHLGQLQGQRLREQLERPQVLEGRAEGRAGAHAYGAHAPARQRHQQSAHAPHRGELEVLAQLLSSLRREKRGHHVLRVAQHQKALVEVRAKHLDGLGVQQQAGVGVLWLPRRAELQRDALEPWGAQGLGHDALRARPWRRTLKWVLARKVGEISVVYYGRRTLNG